MTSRRLFLASCIGGAYLSFVATGNGSAKEEEVSLVRPFYLYGGDASCLYIFLPSDEWNRMWNSLPPQQRIIENESPMAKNHGALSFKVRGVNYLWCQPNRKHYPWVQEIIKTGKLKGYGDYQALAL